MVSLKRVLSPRAKSPREREASNSIVPWLHEKSDIDSALKGERLQFEVVQGEAVGFIRSQET